MRHYTAEQVFHQTAKSPTFVHLYSMGKISIVLLNRKTTTNNSTNYNVFIISSSSLTCCCFFFSSDKKRSICFDWNFARKRLTRFISFVDFKLLACYQNLLNCSKHFFLQLKDTSFETWMHFVKTPAPQALCRKNQVPAHIV